jgi:hypothetical protein
MVLDLFLVDLFKLILLYKETVPSKSTVRSKFSNSAFQKRKMYDFNCKTKSTNQHPITPTYKPHKGKLQKLLIDDKYLLKTQ